MPGPDLLDGRPYPRLGAPIQDDVRALRGQSGGDGPADARGGTGHQRPLSFELQIHGR